MEIQRDTKDMVRYRRDTGEIQAGYPKNTRQGRASGSAEHPELLEELRLTTIREKKTVIRHLANTW